MAEHHRGGWSRDDLRQLVELAGEMPAQMVRAEFNRWAAEHGRPERSMMAIRHQARNLGISLVADGEWVQIRYAAEMLDRSVNCLQLWVRSGRVNARRGVIERASLRRLARREPRLFFGCPPQGLMDLLEDRRLVTWLQRQQPADGRLARHAQPVIRLDTGERFTSIGHAAKATFIHRSTIAQALRAGRQPCGIPFRLAD